MSRCRPSDLRKSDPEVYSIIKRELRRQQHMMQLIASENYTPLSVLEAAGSVLTASFSARAQDLAPLRASVEGAVGASIDYSATAQGHLRALSAPAGGYFAGPQAAKGDPESGAKAFLAQHGAAFGVEDPARARGAAMVFHRFFTGGGGCGDRARSTGALSPGAIGVRNQPISSNKVC